MFALRPRLTNLPKVSSVLQDFYDFYKKFEFFLIDFQYNNSTILLYRPKIASKQLPEILRIYFYIFNDISPQHVLMKELIF